MSWHTLSDFIDEDQIDSLLGSGAPVGSSTAMLCPECNVVVADGTRRYYLLDATTGEEVLASLSFDEVRDLISRFVRYLEVGIE